MLGRNDSSDCDSYGVGRRLTTGGEEKFPFVQMTRCVQTVTSFQRGHFCPPEILR